MIVRESINFERGVDPKQSMRVGFHRPGSLFKYKDKFRVRKELPSIFAYIESDKEYNYYFYLGRLIEESLTGAYLYFGGSPSSDSRYIQNKKDDHMTPVTEKEKKLLLKIFSNENNIDILNSLESKMKTKIILESLNFERGKSEREIKDLFSEWKPGKLVIHPYTDIVYIFREFISEKDWAYVFSLGHLRRKKTHKNPAGKEIFQIYKKDDRFGNFNMKPKKNLRTLTDKELQIIRSYLTPEYIKKLEKEFNLNILL